jgi:flagellar protein FlgJ
MTQPIQSQPASTAAASAPSAAGPSATPAAATYSNLNALSALKADPKSPQALHAVAQQVDAMFLQMMLKSMHEASADVGEPESNAMGMYQDLFDKQIALSMSQHDDLGLGTMLMRQQIAAAAPGTAAGDTASPRAATGRALSAAPPAAAGSVPAATVSAPGATGGVPAATKDGALPTAALAPSPREFVAAVLPAIRAAASALGVNPLGMLAQAALESGWGQRMARSADGTSSLNVFGIKADDAWTGARATAATVEFSGGVATPRRAAFRAYGSIAQSVGDYAKLVSNSPRYRDAIAAGGDAHAYVASIGKSGYATDPAYAAKLTAMLQSNTFRKALTGSGLAL